MGRCGSPRACRRKARRINFAARTASEIKNRWRGFQPWPGAFTSFEGKKFIVHRMVVVHASATDSLVSTEPGRMLVLDGRLLVACAGNTWLELVEVQLEGKKRMPAEEFLRGVHALAGMRLG